MAGTGWLVHSLNLSCQTKVCNLKTKNPMRALVCELDIVSYTAPLSVPNSTRSSLESALCTQGGSEPFTDERRHNTEVFGIQHLDAELQASIHEIEFRTAREPHRTVPIKVRRRPGRGERRGL